MKRHYFSTLIILIIFSTLMTVGQAQDFQLPQPTTLDLAWHPTENWLAVADTEGLRIVNTTTGLLIHSFPVISTPVYAIAWSPDGLRLVSSGADGELKVWDSRTQQLLANFIGHNDTVNAVAWNFDGSLLASTSVEFEGTSVRTWDMTTYQAIIEKQAGFITRLVWSHDNTQLFVSIRNGGGTWAIDSKSMLVSPLTYDIDPNKSFDGIGIDIHPIENLIAAGSADGNIYIQDVELNQTVMTLSGHTDYITDVEWSRDGSFLASVSIDGTVKTWDTVTGQLLGDFQQDNILYALAISPDGTQIAYGGENLGGANGIIPIIAAPQITSSRIPEAILAFRRILQNHSE